jgi:hypothetical protein
LPTARRRRSRRAEQRGHAALARNPADRARFARSAVAPPPQIRLGRTRSNGLAPALLVLLERGAARHPELVASLEGRIVFRYAEDFAPTRVRFGSRVTVVEDGDLRKPDLVISGRLPDIVHVAAAPKVRGVPSPHSLRGLIAIARVARGRLAITGDRRLARSVLRLLAIG